jgi:hypothetical protein
MLVTHTHTHSYSHSRSSDQRRSSLIIFHKMEKLVSAKELGLLVKERELVVHKSPSRCLLIFPKEFEFAKFLFFLINRGQFVGLIDTTGQFACSYDLFFIPAADRVIDSVTCVVFGESDIMFNHRLTCVFVQKGSQWLREFKHILLIGSCGSTHENDVGHMFQVSEVWKADRGSTNLMNVFCPRLEKSRGMKMAKLSADTSKRRCYSVNFFNESCLHPDFMGAESELGGNLFDMETFDFIANCSAFECAGSDRCHCFRFVTDKVSTWPWREDFVRGSTTSIGKQNGMEDCSIDLRAYAQLFKNSTVLVSRVWTDIEELLSVSESPEARDKLMCTKSRTPLSSNSTLFDVQMEFLARIKKLLRCSLIIDFSPVFSYVEAAECDSQLGKVTTVDLPTLASSDFSSDNLNMALTGRGRIHNDDLAALRIGHSFKRTQDCLQKIFMSIQTDCRNVLISDSKFLEDSLSAHLNEIREKWKLVWKKKLPA